MDPRYRLDTSKIMYIIALGVISLVLADILYVFHLS
jgi:hypothetical protein